MRRFALLIEDQLHMSVLASIWNRKFADLPDMSLVVQEVVGCPDYPTRQMFHERYCGKRYFSTVELEELLALYGGCISEPEKEIIASSGLPPCAPDKFPRVLRVSNLNSTEMRDWALAVVDACNDFWCFIFLDTILAPWWVGLPHTRIVNAHSAVLPYARGMCALEQLALTGSKSEFETAAGATVHYIDDGVDTGPVIRAVRLREPFRYSSLVAMKVACYELAFQLLCSVAQEVIANPQREPAGMILGGVGPVFRRQQFTPEKSRLAGDRWLAMKSATGLTDSAANIALEATANP
jgi:phosphoribosylglycinamide formyltransferase-1